MCDEILLAIERLRTTCNRGVSAVGLKLACFGIVAQICVEQHIAQITFGLRICYRCDHFDPVFQVSRHPVSTADEYLIVTAVRKPEDTTVLEETTDDASHG